MKHYLGIDLGTSAMKFVLIDEKGTILSIHSETYPLLLPRPGYSEQDPLEWYHALRKGLRFIAKELNDGIDGLAIDGQMHGLVALDENNRVIRPCILWNDSRSKGICDTLNREKKDLLLKETGNIAYPGFTLPKLLWMKEEEKESYQRIRHILLPKDYLNYCLTGNLCTDYSDASGTLLLDVNHQCWSKKMLGLTGLPQEVLPELTMTGKEIGVIQDKALLSDDHFRHTKVYQGAADNAAAAIACGILKTNECNISLGTSGTIYVVSDRERHPDNGSIHSLLTTGRKNCLLACMLSAASSLQWFNDKILLTDDYQKDQDRIPYSHLGRNNIYFLPYLMGERSPINDPDIRGAFLGLGMESRREDMIQAILEGVSFALKDSFETIKKMNINITTGRLIGGGSKSKLWKMILSNVLAIPLTTLKDNPGPSYGMAITCLVYDHIYPDLGSACSDLLQTEETTEPKENLVSLYQERYRQYQRLYPAIKGLLIPSD